MTFWLSILAAVGCALCNGTAAVLQKVSADKAKPAEGVHVGLLWSLLHDWLYILAGVIDTLGWILTYLAAQHLPLFFVESIIATNLIITALLERFVLHAPLKKATYAATGLILAGVTVLAFAAGPDTAKHGSVTLDWTLALFPVAVGTLALIVGRFRHGVATIGLAALSGVAYGSTSIISRVFPLPHPLWHVVLSPLPYGLIASGFVGVLLFSTALQRAPATVVNACMTSAETFVPTLIGLFVLGDVVRSGRWYDVVIGLTLAIVGTISLAFNAPRRQARATTATQ